MRVLLVDDEETFRERLARALRARGLEVWTASSVEEGLQVARSAAPDVALVDLRMPGPSGLELVKALRVESPQTRTFVLTGFGSIGTAVEAARLGIAGYLQKPIDAEAIVAAISSGQAPEAPEPEMPSLARVEWEHIQRVLSDCKGNVSAAAQQLGIDRRTLQRKLQKLPPRR
ncbi:MAG TPA: response regulator [Myxococcaceae bacterium]|jgi:two-component system response regulator RegA